MKFLLSSAFRSRRATDDWSAGSAVTLCEMPLHHVLIILYVCTAVIGPSVGAASLSVMGMLAGSSSTAETTRTLELIQQFGAWWSRSEKVLPVLHDLPAARPAQPWEYRSLHSARSPTGVTVTSSYAITASVTHAPLKGITAEMMSWWLNNIEGEAPYVGDGKVWDKYLQWHPRDHIYQRAVPPPPDSSSSSPPQAPLWEICEFFACTQAAGYTSSSHQPDQQQEAEYFVNAVTEVQHIGSHSMSMTVPTRWGIGSSLWRLQHKWQDTPDGLLVNSSQVVGVVEPGWRPLWYARWRNALVRGLFSQGRDPQWMLQKWLQHCVEEFGNLEHILPSLYAAGSNKASAGVQADEEPGDSQRPAARDEL